MGTKENKQTGRGCPHCGGTGGFAYNKYIKKEIRALWPEDEMVDERGDQVLLTEEEEIPTMQTKNVKCLNCGKHVPKEVAIL